MFRWFRENRALVYVGAAVGGILWLVSFGIDVVFERFITWNPMLEDFIADSVTALAGSLLAATAYWFFQQYKIEKRRRIETFDTVSHEIREGLQSVLLKPDEELLYSLRCFVDKTLNKVLPPSETYMKEWQERWLPPQPPSNVSFKKGA